MKIFLNILLFLIFPQILLINCFAIIKIQSSINSDEWLKTNQVYPLKGDKIQLKVDKIEGGIIKWYQIIPDISENYKNANRPWEKNPYEWIGLAKIKYNKLELTQFSNQWEINPFENKIEDKNITASYYHKDVGSFWFQVVVNKNGKEYKSAGIEDSDENGISPEVFRISIREEEGYLGYLTSFLNVPGLFGSTVYQSNNYIGADCADVLISAYGKWKNKDINKNYNVGMVINTFSKVSEFNIDRGNPNIILKWNKDIYPGDIIAVKYFGGKQYQHIGALYSDFNKNSILDENDLVIHAGPDPLHKSYLKDGPFDGHIIIVRAE